MYVGARSRTNVNISFSVEFEVKIGVQQRSVLSPLLFPGSTLTRILCRMFMGNALCRLLLILFLI